LHPKLIKLEIGQKNSRQALNVFSAKADTPLCEGNGLQIYGFLPDYLTKMLEN
jgi:hypothetical protein